MFKRFFSLLLIVNLLLWSCNRSKDDSYIYKVVKVKDGDTIELLSPDHQNITVRLAEIDCPEKSQAFGQAAKQFTADQCFGKMVKLIGNQKDRYGRTVAKIELEDGKILNYEIVKNGYAWQYRAYSKDMALALIEERAREQRLGLWHDANPTPPWNFRKEEKVHRGDSTSMRSKVKKAKRHYKKRRSKYRDTVAF